jgi:hypothetical protein
VSNCNSSSSSPSANSLSAVSLSASSPSFSHVLLARINFRVAIPMATCRHADTVNCTPKCLLVSRPNARLNSSPAYGPLASPNKYSDSRRSNARANGRTNAKYCTNICPTALGKHRMMYSVLPLRLRALSYIVKKHTRLLITYIFRAEYILLLTLMDPNSGLRAGWPPVIYMHTIILCKNCRSLVKYARTCLSTYSICRLALFFFNNFYPPSPFRAWSNKYLYPTPT